MRSLLPLFFSSLFLGYSGGAIAIRLSLERRWSSTYSNLTARSPISVVDSYNVLYVTNVTVGGKNFSLQADTGSADLWVIGPVENATDLGKNTTLQYGVGTAEGHIKSSTVSWGEFTVENQVFIDASTGFTKDFTRLQDGILGLGPTFLSSEHTNLRSSVGDTVLDHIFQRNTSTPNFITAYLGRPTQAEIPFSGELTVGEILPGYEDIADQPKLTVAKAAPGGNQFWSVFLDEGGFVGPDGQAIVISSTDTSNISQNSVIPVILDTGSTVSSVPESVAEALWSLVPGANVFNTSSGLLWGAPCDQEVNISFKFGGKTYPVHPSDVVRPVPLGTLDDQDIAVCQGGFQTASPPQFLFGDTFLRSVYILINMGDFIDGTSNTADPYIQLLSTTNDSALVHEQFMHERLSNATDPQNSTSSTNHPDDSVAADSGTATTASSTGNSTDSSAASLAGSTTASATPSTGSGTASTTTPTSSSTSSSTTSSPASSVPQNKSLEAVHANAKAGLSKVTIIGIVAGGVAGLALIVGVVLFFLARRDREGAAPKPGRVYRKLDDPVPEGESLMYPSSSREPYHDTEKTSAGLVPYKDAEMPRAQEYRDPFLD